MARMGFLLLRFLKDQLFLLLMGIFNRLSIFTNVKGIIIVFSTVLAREFFLMVGGISIRHVFSSIDLQ